MCNWLEAQICTHAQSILLRCCQYLCWTQINFLSLTLTDSWILVKILEPNCLPWLSNCKIEKTTAVQLLFSLFIQFSTIEIRSVFSHVKLMISRLKWVEKNLGCPSSLVSYSHLSTDRTQYQSKSAMLSMCVCTNSSVSSTPCPQVSVFLWQL